MESIRKQMPRVTVLDTVGQRGFVSVCVKKQNIYLNLGEWLMSMSEEVYF